MDGSSADTNDAPSLIHRAIDHVAALSLDVQRLRNRHRAGQSVDDADFAWMEQTLQRLALLLIECRDQDLLSP